MLSWWTNIESLAALNNWMLTTTMVFAVLTGIMVFLTAGKSRHLVGRLSEDLETSRKRTNSLEKTAEEIRKELLQTQQHQDINQLKLKTSKSSDKELRQALLDAKKRLKLPKPPLTPIRGRRRKGVTRRKPLKSLIWNWNRRAAFRKTSVNS